MRKALHSEVTSYPLSLMWIRPVAGAIHCWNLFCRFLRRFYRQRV